MLPGVDAMIFSVCLILLSLTVVTADDASASGNGSKKDRLIYFNLRGRGEASRMLYNLANTSFIDERIEFADWPARKQTTPLGFVPLLVTEDGLLNESNVIVRYIAKKLGLLGNSLWEEAVHDMVIENVKELSDEGANLAQWVVYKSLPAPPNKDSLLTNYKGKWVKALNYIQSIAEKRGKKMIVNDEIEAADVYLYVTMEYCEKSVPNLMTLTPWAKAFIDSFKADPRIKNYLKTRPDSPYGV